VLSPIVQVALITAIPGTLAAILTIRNGQKIQEVHVLTNNHATQQSDKIDSLMREVEQLKSAAARKQGFTAGQEEKT
jgi:hypothetical protein